MTGLVLTFAKPKQAKSKEEWESISADGAPPGVYSPNMSHASMELWKAKVTGSRSKCHRIEIRKTLGGSQVVVVVNGEMAHYEAAEGWGSHWKNREALSHGVKISANGAMIFTPQDWADLHNAVREAREVLGLLDFPGTCKVTQAVTRDGEHPLSASQEVV